MFFKLFLSRRSGFIATLFFCLNVKEKLKFIFVIYFDLYLYHN